MKKDNFDLRSYLIENKMTENSRGDVRHQLGKTILDTRILAEMQIPADPDQLEEGDPYDHHDPEYDDNWAAHQGADMADAYNDAQMDAVDEGGVPDLNTVMGEIPSDLQSDKYFKELISANVDDEGNPLGPDMLYFAGSYRDLKQSGKLTGNIEQDLDNICATGDEDLDECGDLEGDMPLDEAGYTDDDDDNWQDDNLDLDDRGGASLLDLVKGDRKAGKARKAAAVDTAADSAMDDEPVDTDAPEIDDPDAENAAGTSDPNAEAQPGLSAQVKYNPNTVEMMMDDQELDQYLSGFRRPQVAVNVLNRAIRTAQDEVNDSIGLNHLYIVLENGFYVTSRTERGQVIAKVTADKEWRKKNFGEN